MTTLKADVTSYDGSFSDPTTAMPLTYVNGGVRVKFNNSLRELYIKAFGHTTQQADNTIFRPLLHYAKNQPNAAVNHNIYKAPNNCLERWKWIVGVENSLDREVQKNYDSQISLLENSHATSVIQLKNQMMAFWHTDRQIKDYKQFKSDEKTRATSGIIGKIFFACVGFLFKRFYNPSLLNVGKNLEIRSQQTFAKIGGFNLNNKDYDVVAFHILADENSVIPSDYYHDDTHRKFHSESSGRTTVGIFEKQQPHSLGSLRRYGPNQNFSALIGREEADSSEISSEEVYNHGQKAVLNSKRHLIVDNGLGYRGRTIKEEGSDRLLDQKLTQIMVEMSMQNKKIISIRVDSNRDDLPVLTAGGFKSLCADEVMKELKKFRSKEGNKLFPPNRNYSGVGTRFLMKDFTENNVSYSRDGVDSWSNIIQREPILEPEAAILPEYWARKPNIVEA